MVFGLIMGNYVDKRHSFNLYETYIIHSRMRLEKNRVQDHIFKNLTGLIRLLIINKFLGVNI